MHPKDAFDQTERVFGGFRPVSPPIETDRAVLGYAEDYAARRRRVLHVVPALSAACVFGLALFILSSFSFAPSKGSRSGKPEKPSSPETASFVTAESVKEEVALRVLGTMRREILNMEEILEAVPSERKEERKSISTKLEDCLRRVSNLENRVRLTWSGSSQRNVFSEKEVRV